MTKKNTEKVDIADIMLDEQQTVVPTEVDNDDIVEVEVLPEYLQQEMTSLEQDILSMDRAYTQVTDRREKIISKMEKVIDKMDLSLEGDPEQIEAQSKYIDTYLRSLKDIEDNHYKRVSIKLKKKQDEKIEDFSACVSKILQNVNVKGVNQTMVGFNISDEEKEQLIQSQFDMGGCIIIGDHELEKDPSAVHELSAVLREESEQIALNRDPLRKI